MTTTPIPPDPVTPTKVDVAERVAVLREDAVRASRTLLTGDANGRLRRNVLFVVAVLGYIIPVLAPLGLVALLLLALTDMVVID